MTCPACHDTMTCEYPLGIYWCLRDGRDGRGRCYLAKPQEPGR